MRYLLDTNIVSSMMKDPTSRLMARIARRDDTDELIVSVIVAAELRYGIEKVQSAKLLRQFEGIVRFIKILPLNDEIVLHYARIRNDLERKGTPIGQNDLLIAAHALALDVVLVTDNEKEFSRIPGLRIENWLRG